MDLVNVKEITMQRRFGATGKYTQSNYIRAQASYQLKNLQKDNLNDTKIHFKKLNFKVNIVIYILR